MAIFLSTTHTSLLVLLSLIASASSATTPVETAGTDAAPQNALKPKVLKLERQSVMLPKTAAHAGKRKNFYSAKISVGHPAQEFHMTFDLGGGTMILPSQSCTDKSCLERRRYDRMISESSEDIQANGQLVEQSKRKSFLRKRDRGTLGLHSIDVGSGTVKGVFVRDQVCVYGSNDDGSTDTDPRCFPLAMLVANEMSDMPFLLEPYDGAIGLGLKGMSVSNEFNFLAEFHTGFASAAIPNGAFFPNSFGLHIGNDADGGEITFGGYDDKRLTQPLQWAPVADPEEGRWQVAIKAIRMGNNTFEACNDRACRAAIDYSSSLLGVPSNLARGMQSALSKLAPPSGFGDGCQLLAIPDLHLDLSNDVTLTLPAEDWISEFGAKKDTLISSTTSCMPVLATHDSDDAIAKDVFILGESTLRRYYTFFNADSLSVGFSLAANGKEPLALPGGKKQGKSGKKDLEGVILLVQVKFKMGKTVSKPSL